MNTINEAYEAFIYELFGSTKKELDDKGLTPSSMTVTRKQYTEAMHKIQDQYGLKQGHPNFMEWVFTLVGNSPTIIEDNEEGAGNDEPTSTN